jgi:hypothetical protein
MLEIRLDHADLMLWGKKKFSVHKKLIFQANADKVKEQIGTSVAGLSDERRVKIVY